MLHRDSIRWEKGHLGGVVDLHILHETKKVQTRSPSSLYQFMLGDVPSTDSVWGGLMVYLGSTFLPTISSLPDVVSAGKKSTVGMRLWCKRVTLETRCTCTLAAIASHSGTLWSRYTIFIDIFQRHVTEGYTSPLLCDVQIPRFFAAWYCHHKSVQWVRWLCIPNLSRKSSNFR